MALMSIQLAIVYMYCIAFGFPDSIYENNWIQIILSETGKLIDIMLQFFKAYKVQGRDGADTYEMNLLKIVTHYLKGDFIYDFFILIPWGLIGHF